MTRWITAILAAVTIGGASLMAATLSNTFANNCAGSATFHFVNNQTGGAGAGSLTANFSDGSSCTTGPSAINQNTQHFFCTVATPGATVTSASTNLPGRLVISGVECGDVKEPPPCDPNKDPNCKP